jgi:drug/metabolite transporter (DMT)-like permease
MSDAARPRRLLVVLAFATIYLVWGSTFLALRYAVADLPPLLTMAVRCLGGALVLGAVGAVRERGAPAGRGAWVVAGVAGALLFAGGHALLAWAEQHVPSAQAALYMATIPAWLVVIDATRLRRLPRPRVWLGLARGIGGVAVLSGQRATAAPTHAAGTGDLAARAGLLASALLWALGSLVARDGSRRLERRGTPAPSGARWSAMQLAAGAACLVVLAIGTGEAATWSAVSPTPRALWALVFLVLGGTALGFSAYNWLLTVASPAAVGSYAFVNPVVALALGVAVGDDRLTGPTVLATACVLGAVLLTRDRPHGEAAPDRGEDRREAPATEPATAPPLHTTMER